MVKRNKKSLDQPRLIAGFFREALFFSRNVLIESAVFGGETKIVEIDEPAARVKSDERYLVLIPSISESRSIERGTFEAEFKCMFPQFVGIWHGIISVQDNGTFRVKMPPQLDVTNHRSGLRMRPVSHGTIKATVLVQTAGLHAEGQLEIENISMNGIGGILRLPAEMIVRPDTRVTGKVGIETGSLNIDCQVAQVVVASDPDSFSNEAAYRVGLVRRILYENNAKRAADSDKNKENDRRRYRRSECNFEIHVRSPVNATHLIRLLVRDVSVGGFAATVTDPSDEHLMPVGCGVALEDSSLIAEVVGFHADSFRFQFISGDNSDRVKWLKRITFYENERTTISSGVGSDLINLFCESGALASGFLKVQRRNAENMLFGMAGESGREPYIHRWIERTPDGDETGHISAQQWGDNSWFLGDLAGSVAVDRRISEAFVSKFMSSFMDSCLASTPCPRVIMTWNEGHPYWSEYETYLLNGGREDVQSRFLTNYHRNLMTIRRIANADLVTKIVSPSDYKLIKMIRSKASCDEVGLPSLLSALDFHFDTFGSAGLKRIILSSKKDFKRQYVYFAFDSHEWIAVFTRYPLGFSPNRSADVAWVIPLTKIELSATQRDTMLGLVNAHAASNGFNLPGILEIAFGINQNDQQPRTKRMQWVVVHPHALGWFRSRG